jgi:hypothetical protein
MDPEAFFQQFPAAKGRLSTREMDGEMVILDLASGHYFNLNEVGAFLWERIDGRHRIEQLVQAVLEDYRVDEATARKDVRNLLQELVREGLIELHREPAEQA